MDLTPKLESKNNTLASGAASRGRLKEQLMGLLRYSKNAGSLLSSFKRILLPYLEVCLKPELILSSPVSPNTMP
jgi:hypothetical protein